MSTIDASAPTPERQDRGFFGHPKSLATIFGVEMWERFSFYGMQGILAIYLYYSASQGGLGISEGTALGIVGAYGGAVYLSAIVGAWVADRLLGAERTLYYSAILIMLGHIALALVPGLLGVGIGLVLVALGSGGLKANATAIVGNLYEPGDSRRDAGFSLFYLGINLGALVGPLLTGLLQKELGFHWGFGLAAVGMAAGLAQYQIGRKKLPKASHHIANPLPASERPKWIIIVVAAIAAIALAVSLGWITADNLSTIVIAVAIIGVVALFTLILKDREITKDERSRVISFIPMFLGSVAFWSLYQQQFTVLAVYSDKQLNRNLLGWEMPVSWINSINPIFIIILSGVFAAMWTKLGDRQPPAPVKFALACLGMGIAFLLFLVTAGGGENSTPILWMVLILFIFTLSELCLSPVGMSLSTKLAPEKFSTQMIALFYLSVSLGSALAGELAGLYTSWPEVQYFGTIGAISIVLGVALWLGSKPILRLMRGVR